MTTEAHKDNIARVLKQSPIFAHIDTSELRNIAQEFESSSYSENTVIIREGDPSDHVFIIQYGEVAIWKNYDTSRAIKLSVYTTGGVFGEMSLFDDFPRSASAVCTQKTGILSLHKKNFLALCDSHAQIMNAVLHALSTMVRNSNETLVSALSAQNLELQNALQHLQAAQTELIRSERFSNLGKLSSMLIHDLRNPLAVIKGYAEMLQVLPKGPEDINNYAKKIVNEVRHLNNFASELLDYSRGSLRLQRTRTTVPAILQKLQGYLEGSSQYINTALQIHSTESPPFYVDEGRILRALLNICDNAHKAMNDGAELYIHGSQKNEDILFLIRDNGHGMTEDVLRHIFDPFFSSSKNGGTGLGMLSVQNTVQAHSGEIHVESEPDKGTTVHISIPLAKNQLPSRQKAEILV